MLTAHVYKHHLALDKAPYYCTLCLMRCTTKSALINHVTKYSRHRLAAAVLGATNDGGYLVENPRAAELVCGRDYRKISSIEASKLFRSNGRDSVEDFSDQEGEFCHEPAQAVRAMPAVSSLPVVSNGTSGFINVQLTPEMLSNLLKNQPLQNNLFHSSFPQATSSEMSVTKTAEVPLYSPVVASVPSYTPTPIATKTLPLLKSLPFISSANKSTSSLNPTGTAFGPPQLSMPQIVTLSEPSTCHAQTHPTSTEERQPKSTLSTTRIGNTTET